MRILLSLLFIFSFCLEAYSKEFYFKWGNPDYDFSEFVVEVYEDQGFNKLLLREVVKENKILLKFSDVIYLRVAVVTADGEMTEFSNLSKINILPGEIQLKSPSESELFSLTPGETLQKVDFAWFSPDIKNCQVEVVQDQSAEPIANKESDVRGTETFSTMLAAGDYYWKVVCDGGDRVQVSDQRLFQIRTAQKAEPIIEEDFGSPYQLKAFFTVSYGRYEETGSTGTKVKQNQNSPGTLGVMGSYRLSPKRSISGSFYLSYLTTLEEEGVASRAAQHGDPPLEVALNAFYNIKFDSVPGFSFYAGFDLERWNAINTDQLSSNLPLEFLQQTMGYLSIGANRNQSIFGREFLFRLGISQSVYSGGDENPVNGENYKGQKYILYTSTQISSKWGIHGFCKYHDLSGAGDLKFTRLGIGVDYKFL